MHRQLMSEPTTEGATLVPNGLDDSNRARDRQIGHGSAEAIIGPNRFAIGRGSRDQTRVARRKAPLASGLGVAPLPLGDHCCHSRGIVSPLHWSLNRWVPPPGVQRPKLNVRAPLPITRSMNDQ